MPIRALYRSAEAILRPAAGQWNIPLRLDERRGQLLSALPRLLRAKGEPFSCPPLPDGSPFSHLEERGGMAVFTVSPLWLRARLAELARPLPHQTPLTGIRRHDRENSAFLRDYTLRRCQRLAARDGEAGETDPALALMVLSGRPREEILRRYWSLPARTRRDPVLARAVAALAGE